MKVIITNKGTLFLGILCLVIFSMSISVHAQKVIEPGLGTINETILGDTLVDGSRSETHYILKRDGWYIYNERMDVNFSLTIEAEAGDGARPVVKPFAIEGGAPNPFDVYAGGLTLRGIHFDCYDNSLPAPGNEGTMTAVRLRGDGVRLVIDDCRFDRGGKYLIRSDNPGTDLFITNTVISNCYQFGWPGNATIFGNKDVDADSLIVSNCTMYNLGVFNRRYQTQSNYTKIEHCTFVNFHGSAAWDRNAPEPLVPGVEQTWSVIALHKSKKAVFRNNLLVNCGFFGRQIMEEGLIPQYIVSASMIPDGEGWVLPDGIDIRNNNIWFDPALADVYTATGDSATIYTPDYFYDATLQQFIDEGNTANSLMNLEVNFVDGPRAPLEVVEEWYTTPGGNVLTLFPRDSRIMEGPDVEGTLDFSYTDAALQTASTQGQPLGDLNWFGMEMTPTEDEFATVTDVERDKLDLPNTYTLHQNYPNPFNPETTISYQLKSAAIVKLTIYNSLGQIVKALVKDIKQSAGDYTLYWDGLDEDGREMTSGVYFYKLEADNYVQVRKMILMR